jgi:hypothetical protein
MNREELNGILRETPVRIRMNDGRAYDVLDRELVTVSDFAASVLHRHPDGKLRHVYLPLAKMCALEPLSNGV